MLSEGGLEQGKNINRARVAPHKVGYLRRHSGAVISHLW